MIKKHKLGNITYLVNYTVDQKFNFYLWSVFKNNFWLFDVFYNENLLEIWSVLNMLFIFF